MAQANTSQGWIAGAGARICLLWAGVSLGVAFLATPAKFLAPTLSLPVALDVGSHTFKVYNGIELALLAVVVIVSAWSDAATRWKALVVVPGAIVVLQSLWLIPALDVRVAAIQDGAAATPSPLHSLYIVAEALKVTWLFALGWIGAVPPDHGRTPPHGGPGGEAAAIQARWRP